MNKILLILTHVPDYMRIQLLDFIRIKKEESETNLKRVDRNCCASLASTSVYECVCVVKEKMEAVMGLMRRIPPKHTETALSALLSLMPHHSSDLLSQVDQPLQVSLFFCPKSFLNFLMNVVSRFAFPTFRFCAMSNPLLIGG